MEGYREERILTTKPNTSQNPSTSVVSAIVSVTSSTKNNTKLREGAMDRGDTNRKTGDGHTISHCSHSLLKDCSGIRKEVENWEKVHWEPPSILITGVTKIEKRLDC